MSLKCAYVGCANFELARFDQLAFYQDINTGGWNLSLGPEFTIPGSDLPPNIRIVDTGDTKFPYNGVCANCLVKLGQVNSVCGFENQTLNFSWKKVYLSCSNENKSTQKWSKVVTQFPQIRKITATVLENGSIIGSNTIHFHGRSELEDMINAAMTISKRSNLILRRYQWYSYFFACFNNVLLCLPTGMGKTLIATLLMNAYYERNLNKIQVFIVPTVVLVEQQADVIEKFTGLKVIRRSGEELKKSTWELPEICVCTPAMLLNAIKFKQVDMCQLSLLVLDEVHEANSPLSPYGLLLPYLTKCPASQRPRVLGLTASPLISNSSLLDARQSISALCDKLGAVPYTPLLDDTENKPNAIECKYVSVDKTSFEITYETFVIQSLESLARLHKFFDTNWKPILDNAEIQNKIAVVMKNLSHAKLMAQHMDDIRLHQLIQYMYKWVDSLEMLQVSGPRKLIVFIQTDLDFAVRNDALSNISSEIGPIVRQMKMVINRIAYEYDIPENSPRLEELLRFLKQTTEDRILIFVERRNTAERLCRRLKMDSEIMEMNPTYIVSNARIGSVPKDLQKSILEMFRKGECKLLISTTVLEQGIDITACGLVICFDGVKSLKSIIQSRGRARKSEAHFVAFVEARKQRIANELTQLEVAMNYAIRQLMSEYNSAFEPIVKQEIENFLDSGLQTVEETSNSNQTDDEDDEDEIVDEEFPADQRFIQFRFFNFVSVTNMTDQISSCFSSKMDRLTIKKRYINAYFAVKNIVTDSTIIKKISASAIPGKQRKRLCSWFHVNIPIVKEDGLNDGQPQKLAFNMLIGFYFKDYTTVCFDANPIWNKEFHFDVVNNEIVLTTCASQQFRLNAYDISGPILINDTEESYKLFLCMRTPPAYFEENQLCPFDFHNRSFNLCLIRKGPMDFKHDHHLRYNFRYLQIYNVCNLKEKILTNEDSIHDDETESNDFTKNFLIKVWHTKHSAVLPTTLPKTVLSQFLSCKSVTSLELQLNNTSPIRFKKLQIQDIHNVPLPFPDCHAESGYTKIGRVEVTPSRFKFIRLERVQKNRILRYFPNPENFLMISFTDEHGGNPWRSKYVYEWFLSVLQQGIKVGKTVYTFLGCSNSQLREGRCWFSCLNRQDVYDKIGYFPYSWSAGRTLTRIALAFATSIQTVQLNERYFKTVAPDVEINGVNFSDGIGRASQELIATLTSMVNIPQKTSAFQIRVGGVKGVISVYDQTDDVTFRKSMKKFESHHNMLEVLNYSRSIPLYLNRHVILLLSHFGVPDKVFLELQYDTLVTFIDKLVDDDSSLSFVKTNSNIFDWQMYPPSHMVREPFFRQILFSNAIDLIKNITNRAHIPVSDGRVLMGVMDETGTLSYGEVYAHIVESDADFELTGKLVVFRNPCVLPSDLRVLNACDKSRSYRLRQLYQNCLVIPSHGPDSHARECSGGDLDGDLYYVIWDKNLIPPNLKSPGMKVVEVITNETQPPNSGDKHNLLMEFYCDYVSKSQLGIIANAHLASADKYGVLHFNTLMLAKLVTAETDAPKKGLTVGKIDSKLLPLEYPDYMRKSDKPSYRSETVLGELYRESEPILQIFLEKRAPSFGESPVIFTRDTKSIENYYALYSFEVHSLLHSLNLKTEVDLFSGTPSLQEEYMSAYNKQTQFRQIVIENAQLFWQKWKTIFERWLSMVSNNQKKIFEWYSRPQSEQHPMHSFSFLAMPYVNFEECNQKPFTEKILLSSMRWVFCKKMQWLSEWRLRFNVGQAVMRKLEPIECHFYGSSMLGLSEEYSDIDLYAGINNLENLTTFLKDLDENVASMKKPHSCVSLTFDSVPIEVTNFAGGVRKTYALAEAFDNNPGLWAALRVLIEWARIARLVKSGGSEGLMTLVSFCHLFIYFATASPPQTEFEIKPYSLKRFGDWMESIRNSSCGELIYGFLKHLGDRNNREWFVTKVDPLTGESLIRSGLIDELCRNAELALYILGVHDGDVQKLFERCAKKRLFRIEKGFANTNNTSEDRQKELINEIKMKCNPKNFPNLFFELVERNELFYIEVSGDHKHFGDVEKEINKINKRVRNTELSMHLSRQKAYHVVNSTIIIAEFGNGSSTEVSFRSYDGDLFAVQHIRFMKFKLIFRNMPPNIRWRENEYERYKHLFLKQIQSYKEKRGMKLQNSKLKRFFSHIYCNIRSGNHYLFHIPETLCNSFDSISLKDVERKIAYIEENFELVKEQDAIKEAMHYNRETLMRSFEECAEPLELMPLQEMMTRGAKKNIRIKSAQNPKNVDGIRHSFYPVYKQALNNAREFAARHGFREVQPEPDDYYTTISLFWRQRELVICCDKLGFILEIRHRSTRWLSVTICRSDQDGGDDVRVYLECRLPLDESESFIQTIIEYLKGRSLFTDIFDNQIQRNCSCPAIEEPFSTKPLISEIFHLNLCFRSMRVLTPVLKFVNDDNDIIVVHKVDDGFFQASKREFEWLPKHFEFEIRLCTETLSEEELCKKSYDFSLSLFDFTKRAA